MAESNLIKEIFSESEIEAIDNTPIKDRRHPLKRLFSPTDRDEQVLFNTNSALSRVMKEDNEWLDELKIRMLDVNDYSSSSSALGELRAYGNMLESGLKIYPINESNVSTPDFNVEHESGDKIEIEVHSKQYYKEASEDLEKFKNVRPKGENVVVREHVVSPFGKSKKGENSIENAISKITQIKKNENQFSKNIPSVLWLDFQDELWDLALNCEALHPVVTWRGDLFSGPIWYAFYGYENAPIFAGESTQLRIKSSVVRMKHYGRYSSQSQSKVDATIISFPRGTFILENPYSMNSIPSWFFEKIIHVPWFRYELSKLNWPAMNLKQIIDNDVEIISNFDKLKLYSW